MNNDINKPLPCSPDAERAVLSLAMQDAAVLNALPDFTAAHFYDPANAIIWRGLRATVEAGSNIDMVTLTEHFATTGKLESIGGPAALAEIYSSSGVASHLPDYADTLREKLARRKAWQAAEHAQRAALNEAVPLSDAIAAPLEKLVNSLDGKGKRGSSPLTRRTLEEIMALPEDTRKPIWENEFLNHDPTERLVICGMGGVGKSRLTLQFAMACRAGVPFLGWKTNGTELTWLFLQTENGNRRLKKEIPLMLQSFGLSTHKQITEGITFHTIESDNDGILCLTDSDSRGRVVELVKSVAADIVVFDPLRDATSGDLNSDRDMTQVCAAITQITRQGKPTAIPIVVHHAGEGSQGIAKATGHNRSQFGRNSKALRGWARSQINIAPGSPDSNDLIIIAPGKANNAAEFAPIAAKLDPEAFTYHIDKDFDFEAWRDSLEGKRSKGATSAVVEILEELGGYGAKSTVHAKLMSGGMGKHRATDLIKEAEAEDLIIPFEKPRPPKKPEPWLKVAG